MIQKTYTQPAVAPSHPGEVLKSGFIDQYHLSVSTVAQLLGLTRVHFSRIINGHSPVTPDIAIRLEVLTLTPASQWLALQAKYDAWKMEQQTAFHAYRATVARWVSDSVTLTSTDRLSESAALGIAIQAGILAKQMKNPHLK